MKITAATTDEQITAPIAAAKIALFQATNSSLEDDVLVGEKLVDLAQAVWSAEALASAQIRYRNILKHDLSLVQRAQFLMEVATKTDDTWSGRRNDARRSAADAVRAWATNEMLELSL